MTGHDYLVTLSKTVAFTVRVAANTAMEAADRAPELCSGISADQVAAGAFDAQDEFWRVDRVELEIPTGVVEVHT